MTKIDPIPTGTEYLKVLHKRITSHNAYAYFTILLYVDTAYDIISDFIKAKLSLKFLKKLMNFDQVKDLVTVRKTGCFISVTYLSQ